MRLVVRREKTERPSFLDGNLTELKKSPSTNHGRMKKKSDLLRK